MLAFFAREFPRLEKTWEVSLEERLSHSTQKNMERVTPQSGTHNFNISPDARYAVDIHSTISTPPVATLYSLPSMRVIRVLQDNAPLKSRLAQVSMRPAEFIKGPNVGGVSTRMTE